MEIYEKHKNISTQRQALFLDRDGVINVDKCYVSRSEDIEFIDGIFDLCRAASERGMPIVVVTNQSGIARGYYSDEQFHILTNWMYAQFEKARCPLSAVYYCPYHPTGGLGKYRQDSYDRKPNPGMLLGAQKDLALDMKGSIMVGDNPSDILAARAAGVGVTVLFGSDAKGSSPSRVMGCMKDICLYFEQLYTSMADCPMSSND